jgi:hypothetical protein
MPSPPIPGPQRAARARSNHYSGRRWQHRRGRLRDAGSVQSMGIEALDGARKRSADRRRGRVKPAPHAADSISVVAVVAAVARCARGRNRLRGGVAARMAPGVGSRWITVVAVALATARVARLVGAVVARPLPGCRLRRCTPGSRGPARPGDIDVVSQCGISSFSPEPPKTSQSLQSSAYRSLPSSRFAKGAFGRRPPTMRTPGNATP